MSELVEAALTVADSQVGIREHGRNDGPEVRDYLASVRLGPGYAWCAAFVYWCWREAALSLDVANPCPRTGGALKLWAKAPAAARHQVPRRGDVFVIGSGGGLGHVGFVWDQLGDGKTLITIEGNTNASGSRNGDGVYKRARQRHHINVGYLRLG